MQKHPFLFLFSNVNILLNIPVIHRALLTFLRTESIMEAEKCFLKKLKKVNIMKKIKLVALIAVMLVAAMALSSCATKTIKDYSEILNPDYNIKDEAYQNVSRIESLVDYSVEKDSEFFVVLSKENKINKITNYAVFSLTAKEVIAEYECDESTQYAFEFVNEAPICIVKRGDKPENDYEEVEYRNTYIDAKGTELFSMEAKYDTEDPVWVEKDLILLNSTLYAIDFDNGTVKKEKSVPAYVSMKVLKKHGDYYYSYGSYTLTIYDEDFKTLNTWTIPKYGTLVSGPYYLNNGDIIIQYYYELEKDAKNFDIVEREIKYDLVTVLISTNGKEKTLNFDFVIGDICANYEVYDENAPADENVCNDKFENIAVIYEIKDHHIDSSAYNADIVLFSNKGKIGKSLKCVEAQSPTIPEKIGDDLYMISTVYGAAIVNSEAEVKYQLSNGNFQDLRAYEAYGYVCVENKGVYDMSFNLVCDFNAENASLAGIVGDTVFVHIGNDDVYTLVSFRGGVKTEIMSCAEGDKDTYTITSFGYVINNVTESEEEGGGDTVFYVAYNEEGKVILESDYSIYEEAAGENAVLVCTAEKEGKSKHTVYYVIYK